MAWNKQGTSSDTDVCYNNTDEFFDSKKGDVALKKINNYEYEKQISYLKCHSCNNLYFIINIVLF